MPAQERIKTMDSSLQHTEIYFYMRINPSCYLSQHNSEVKTNQSSRYSSKAQIDYSESASGDNSANQLTVDSIKEVDTDYSDFSASLCLIHQDISSFAAPSRNGIH
jgi:hypothetical protein